MAVSNYVLIGSGLILVGIAGMLALYFARRKVRKAQQEVYNYLDQLEREVPPGESRALIERLKQETNVRRSKLNDTKEKKGWFRWSRKKGGDSAITSTIPTATTSTASVDRGLGDQRIEAEDQISRRGIESNTKRESGTVYGEYGSQTREAFAERSKLPSVNLKQSYQHPTRVKRKVKLY